jgi:UDP-N-acetylmuramoylalanine--D-glutamate ligase
MKGEIRKYAKSALLFRENKDEIYSVIKDVNDCYMADDLDSAIDMGCAMAGDVCLLLLSPASASYDTFKSFEERGEIFQKLVRQRYGL